MSARRGLACIEHKVATDGGRGEREGIEPHMTHDPQLGIDIGHIGTAITQDVGRPGAWRNDKGLGAITGPEPIIISDSRLELGIEIEIHTALVAC